MIILIVFFLFSILLSYENDDSTEASFDALINEIYIKIAIIMVIIIRFFTLIIFLNLGAKGVEFPGR